MPVNQPQIRPEAMLQPRRHGFILSFLCIVLVMICRDQADSQPSRSMVIKDVDGDTRTLGQYLGNGPVYVSFWALWCAPCKEELRALKKVVADNPDKKFTVLAINQDTPKSLSKVKAYVKSQNYPFPIILDPNMQVFQSFNGQNLPFSVLLNSNGDVIETRTGYLPGDEKEIAEAILRLASETE